MAKREYTGEPIDMTDAPGETHLSKRDGETVAGTSDDDFHDEKTDAWPSGLDRDEFTDLQAEIIEQFCMNPNATHMAIAENTEGSDTSVYNVKHKISAMGKGDAVPFDVPDEPTASVKAAQPYMDDGYDDSADVDTAETTSEQNGVDDSIARMYESGHSTNEIATELGMEEQTVRGKIGALHSTGVLGNGGTTPDKEPVETDETPDETSDSETNGEIGNRATVTFELETAIAVRLLENQYISNGVKEELLNSVR